METENKTGGNLINPLGRSVSKIMKSKMLTITAIMAVMVAMTGIAAADQINVYEPSTTTEVTTITLVPGGPAITKDLVVSAFTLSPPVGGQPHTLTDSVIVLPGSPAGALPGDISIRYQELTPLGPLAGAPYPWTQEGAAGASEKLDVQFQAAATAPPGATYSIQITDDNGVTQTVSVQILATAIPEFPTVALPVGAAIGLLFLFQRRKNKEE
ncbi:MAG TPA: PEF-CTERM sorting domain-containing protein [Candidatus Methanoperedens sp.]